MHLALGMPLFSSWIGQDRVDPQHPVTIGALHAMTVGILLLPERAWGASGSLGNH